MLKTRLLLFAILLLFGRLQAQQPTGSGAGSSANITFVVRNESTGFAVPGAVVQVTAPNGKTSKLTTAANGKLLFTAVNGKYLFTITANGYDPIETYFASGEETNIEANINLDPVGNNAPPVSEQQLRTNVNQAIISGYVRDAAANQPLAGVQASAGGKTVITDSKGFFSIQLSAASTIADGAVPEKATIRFTKAGYAPHSIQNFYLIPDTYTLKVAMSPANNVRAQQVTEETEIQEHGLFDRKETDEQLRYNETAEPQARVEGIMAITVPASIRVGTHCSCTSCSSVQVMSLEKYVQTGLNDEWIASWGAASLRAGAVAYRSYGAYYVKHPVKSNFDIAATTCNQVWDGDGSSSCTSAANATAKVVLIKSGAIYRAEYSAENNNAGCGNGYSGTRTTWPCIKDERCAGRATSGHGRGMCQWGSSFWARDKTYTWILNHYYQPGGVSIQTPASVATTTEFEEKEGSASDDRTTDANGALKVTPNPVTGSSVTIEYKLDVVSQPASIVVTNNYGNVVQQRSVILQQGVNRLTIPTGGFKTGIYNITIRLSATGKSKSSKLIVVK
ncbi:hypothetical protein A3860_29165 [Niastella vici]|uniref:Sporulation stage II protein D amidase enhancer LytB N-terminal domain-containing protein n=1 Tax=Niastella vici TaxID=1703345 RepID=A0A1V9FVS5_9BACT|nr:SpoIID/LytB domain-containing protein [Niastella vici]OQP62430.1 hypothetical protein A3860_29165 [Niastella vici]